MYHLKSFPCLLGSPGTLEDHFYRQRGVTEGCRPGQRHGQINGDGEWPGGEAGWEEGGVRALVRDVSEVWTDAEDAEPRGHQEVT